ncbi:MAG: YncE family protein [Micromonosporaceae bacterium]
MNTEQQLRDDLSGVASPPELVPPANLADDVLTGVRRQRRTRAAVIGVAAVVAVVAVAIPVVMQERAGPVPPGGVYPSATDPGAPAEPVFPTPGGGPNAIHVYAVDSFTSSYLLNEETGGYRKLPYELVLSPDLKTAAVSDGNRAGLADRAELASDGESAVRWLAGRQPYSGISWAPDGKSVAFTALHKGDSTVSFTAHRYDRKGTKLATTPVGAIVGNSVGWNADSTRYVVLRPAGDADGMGPLEMLNMDGSLHQKLVKRGEGGRSEDVGPGIIGGAESYSEDRRSVILDASWLDTGQKPVGSQLLQVDSWNPRAELRPGWRPVGWYDEQRLIGYRLDDRGGGLVLEIRYVESDKVLRSVPAPGLQPATRIQIGSSKHLAEPARNVGF